MRGNPCTAHLSRSGAVLVRYGRQEQEAGEPYDRPRAAQILREQAGQEKP